MLDLPDLETGTSPQSLGNDLWVFPANSSSNGSTSWFLGAPSGSILVDCPPLTKATVSALRNLSSSSNALILLTNREGHGKIRLLQEILGWPVLLQEQEEYLLPGLTPMETFSEQHEIHSGIRVLWTPGPTPGSCVVHAPSPWNVLFCGRLLIPISERRLASCPTGRTFHRTRQRRSLEKLRSWIPSNASPSLASGAALGMLKAEPLVPWEGWEHENPPCNQAF